MPRGRIRIKTLVKFLRLCSLAKERSRLLTIDEIIQELHFAEVMHITTIGLLNNCCHQNHLIPKGKGVWLRNV